MAAAVDAFVADVTASLHSKFGPATPRYYAAKKAVSFKHRLGELHENSILEYARARKMEETIVALALLCSLPSDVIERALDGRSRGVAPHSRESPRIFLGHCRGAVVPRSASLHDFQPRARRPERPVHTVACVKLEGGAVTLPQPQDKRCRAPSSRTAGAAYRLTGFGGRRPGQARFEAAHRPGPAATATNRPGGQISSVYRNRVKPQNQKYSALQKWQIRSITLAVPCPPRGVCAIVTARRAQDAMDAVASGGLCSPGETSAAYGEVVWSWRRDPGVKPSGKSRMATVARKAASPGRARSSR